MNLIKSSNKHGDKPSTNKKSKFPTDYLETLSAKVSLKNQQNYESGFGEFQIGGNKLLQAVK